MRNSFFFKLCLIFFLTMAINKHKLFPIENSNSPDNTTSNDKKTEIHEYKYHELNIDIRLLSLTLNLQRKLLNRFTVGLGGGAGPSYMFFAPKVRQGAFNESDSVELYHANIFGGAYFTQWLKVEAGIRVGLTDTINICYHSCGISHPDGYHKSFYLNLMFRISNRDNVWAGITMMYGLYVQQNGTSPGIYPGSELQGIEYSKYGFSIMPLMRLTYFFDITTPETRK